jgi:hypothetical protein
MANAWEDAPVVSDATPAWQSAPLANANTSGGMPLEPPPQPTKADYTGWDVPNKPAPTKPAGKPKTWDEEHPMVRFSNMLPEPIATIAGVGEVIVPEIAGSIGRGAKKLYDRMHGPLRPETIKGLDPDEFGAFSTLMGFGAGDLPGAGGVAGGVGASAPDKATRMVTKRLAQDMKAQGSTPAEVAEELRVGRESGKPLMLADVGENTRGLLGTMARQPGEAKQAVTKTLTERDEGAYPRSQADIAQGLGTSPTTKQTHAGIKQNQQLISQPLYDAAYEGGSIAPLEHQITGAWNKAAKASQEASNDLNHANNQLTAARAKLTQTGGNVYSESAAREEVRDAEMAVRRAERALDQAEGQKTQVHDILRQSQADAEMNKPGAVWTPYIQTVLEDPIVRAGIRRGMESQRLEGLAKRTTIDPTEYTIIGADELGNPIVGKTPNMKTLDAVKRGMDHIIQSERQADGSLTQRGREIYLVREQFLQDVDEINPMYKKARSTWAGEAAADDALNTGKNFEKFANPEDLADVVKAMSEPEKEFMRIGVANRLREKIGNLSVKGDEAKTLLNTPFMKERMKAVFPTPEAAMDFIQRVDTERRMFETKLNTMGNSQTANRLSEDVNHTLEAGIRGAHSMGHAAHGNYLASLLSAWRSVRAFALRPDPVLNKKIADILMDPTAIPAEGVATNRLPGHTVAGRMLGQSNIRPGQLTIQRGTQQTLDQLGGPP